MFRAHAWQMFWMCLTWAEFKMKELLESGAWTVDDGFVGVEKHLPCVTLMT